MGLESFFEKAAELLGKANDSLIEKQAQIDRYQMMARTMTDEQLKRAYEHSVGTMKMGYGQELKQRNLL